MTPREVAEAVRNGFEGEVVDRCVERRPKGKSARRCELHLKKVAAAVALDAERVATRLGRTGSGEKAADFIVFCEWHRRPAVCVVEMKGKTVRATEVRGQILASGQDAEAVLAACGVAVGYVVPYPIVLAQGWGKHDMGPVRQQKVRMCGHDLHIHTGNCGDELETILSRYS